MKSFNLTKERKARVWLSELPTSFQTDELSCKKVVQCEGSVRPLRTTIAVEIFVPAGGRFLYGLLGIQSLGKSADKTRIEIPIFSRPPITHVSDSLAGTVDKVVPWIDDEYHAAILAGMSAAVGEYAIVPERIRICSGRQGLVGSSPEIFRRLAFICMTLLAIPEEDIGWKTEELIDRG